MVYPGMAIYTNFFTPSLGPLQAECGELTAIFIAAIRKAKRSGDRGQAI